MSDRLVQRTKATLTAKETNLSDLRHGQYLLQPLIHRSSLCMFQCLSDAFVTTPAREVGQVGTNVVGRGARRDFSNVRVQNNAVCKQTDG